VRDEAAAERFAAVCPQLVEGCPQFGEHLTDADRRYFLDIANREEGVQTPETPPRAFSSHRKRLLSGLSFQRSRNVPTERKTQEVEKCCTSISYEFVAFWRVIALLVM
jgi:hypothetical protein